MAVQHWRRVVAVWLTLLLQSCAPNVPHPPASPRPGTAAEPLPAADDRPKGQLSREVMPLAYDLDLQIDPEGDRFSGQVRIAVDLMRGSQLIWLHAQGLSIRSAHAEFGGESVAGTVQTVDEDGLSRFDFRRALPSGRGHLVLTYDAPFDRHLGGLYKVQAGGKAYAFTQFEPIHARKALPCFDEPAFKTPFSVSLTVPEADGAVSNAPERATEPVFAGYKRIRFAPTEPLPTYLLALMVGPFDVVTAEPIGQNAIRDRPLPLRGVAVRGQGARLGYALAHAGPLLAELERYFGIAYPYPKLDLIAVPDFAAGAMENAGAITFRESLLLLDPDDAPESQRRAYMNVTAHELAHHWTGNLVTMPWWNDIWLNEAFATWAASRTLDALHPEQRAGIEQLESVLSVMDVDSRKSARTVRQPIVTTHDIANAFDGITYQKGAGVLAMFERYLGTERFRSGVAAYLRAHAHATATAADLFAALGRAAGQDVTASMSSFLDQAGVPLLRVEPRCEGTHAELIVTQSRYVPAGSTLERERLWQVPACVRYESRGQIRQQCSPLTAARTTLRLEHPGCPSWVMPNADGAGYYRWSLPAGSFARLRSAGFSRLTAREKLSVVDAMRSGFAAGELSARDLFASLPMLAGDADRSVATAPIEFLRFAREYLLDETSRPQLDHFASALYAPRLRALGYRQRSGDDGEIALLRAELVAFLALVVRDPAVRASLAEHGRAELAGRPGSDALAPDARGVAAMVAMQDGDAPLFDASYVRLAKLSDPIVRERLLNALCSVTDARSSRARALALDPVLRTNEVMMPLRHQFGEERTREAALGFLQANWEAIVGRIDPERAAALLGLASVFCSAPAAEPVAAFFAPRAEQLRGGPRALAASLESLRLCAARVALQRDAARAFFSPGRGATSR
jgi:cytosol alanyl aminopeptidase